MLDINLALAYHSDVVCLLHFRSKRDYVSEL